MKRIQNIVLISSIILTIFGFIAIVVITSQDAYSGNSLDSSNAAQFGDFIGGFVGTLFALASIGFIVATFINQQISFDKQQFESKFFELIKLHRENVDEIQIREENGKKAFELLVDDLGKIILVLRHELSLETNDPKIAHLSYLILFFGCKKLENKDLINKSFEPLGISTDIFDRIWGKCLDISKKGEHKGKRLAGTQSELGNYFRNLFQTVNFVDRQKNLDKKEKYFYVKTLRAQLSTFEQIILFFNTLSSLGWSWELKKGDSSDTNLITNYKLIKNIPYNSTFGFNPKYFYNFRYEFEEIDERVFPEKFTTDSM